MADFNELFGDVNFNSPLPQVNEDQVVALLSSFTAPTTRTDLVQAPAGQQPVGASRTDGGAERVNANSAATGVTATKDANGRTVLSNSTKPASTASAVTTSPETPKGAYVQMPNTVTSLLGQLKSATDMDTARGLYSTFQTSAVTEITRIEQEAFTFANNKLGIPALQQAVIMGQQQDKASIGWYHGIGDSPPTIEAKRQLTQAITFADNEAKNFLTTNLNYNLLKNVTAQAAAEMKRVENLNQQKINRDERSNEMEARRGLIKMEKEEDLASRMSGVQLSRIQTLRPAEFAIVDGQEPKLKAYRLYEGNKDKSFRAAVDAEGEALPVLALQGNKYAKVLAVAEEAAKTGMNTAQVEEQFKQLQTLVDDPKLMERAMLRAVGDDKKKLKEEENKLKLANMGNPNKMQDTSERRIRFALQELKAKKTAVFMGDVTSWGSIDPSMQVAIDASRKQTANASFDNVLTAFIGDSTGSEAIVKASSFRSIMTEAAAKHKDSMFGMPDYKAGEAIIASKVVRSGFWRKQFDIASKAIQAKEIQGGADMLAAIPGIGNLPATAVRLYQGMIEPGIAPIDPGTGRPFGE